jgi:excisionase family DNA binding protein
MSKSTGGTSRLSKEQNDKLMSNENMEKRLLTTEQVAEIICCSPKTVYAWAELGHIPCIKIGKGRKSLLRFDSDEVRAWIRQWKEETRTRYNDSAGTVAGARKGG